MHKSAKSIPRSFAAALGYFIVVLCIANATPAVSQVPPIPGAPEQVLPFRADPDGGSTLNLTIDDGIGGTYSYSPLVAGVTILGQPALATGIFLHNWQSNAGTPMQTIGVFNDLPNPNGPAQRVRLPLLLLENTTLDMNQAASMISGDTGLLSTNALLVVPALLNLALPQGASASVSVLPPPAGGPYGHPPPIYVWISRKSSPAGTAWVGVFADRKWQANPIDPNQSTYRLEVGEATRTDSGTTRLAGVYVENDITTIETALGSSSQNTFIAGATTAAGDVPLAEFGYSENLQGAHYLDHPENYQGDFVVGVRGGQDFVPLIGVRTKQQITYGSDTTNQGDTVSTQETHRRTDLGVYAGSVTSFVPLVGYDYYGRRLPQDLWLSSDLDQGGPGDQISGDWLASVGFYTGGLFGQWTPLVGIAYDDDFAGHHFQSRSRYSIGSFILGSYQPVVETTYDGDLPFFSWLNDFTQAQQTSTSGYQYHPWEVSAGPVANGSYVPVAGVQFGPGVPVGDTGKPHAWHLYAGTYFASYGSFLPLLWAAYDGDSALGVWATLAAYKIFFGQPSSAGTAEITAGASAGGLVFVPLAAANLNSTNPNATIGSGNQLYYVAGGYVPDASKPPGSAYTFVPLVGVASNSTLGLPTPQAPGVPTPGAFSMPPLPSVGVSGPQTAELEVAVLQPAYTPIACISASTQGPPVLVPCPNATALPTTSVSGTRPPAPTSTPAPPTATPAIPPTATPLPASPTPIPPPTFTPAPPPTSTPIPPPTATPSPTPTSVPTSTPAPVVATWQFTIDSLHRLAGSAGESFTYDRTGNRLTSGSP